MITLWISETSPFARKTRIVVIEKGLSDKITERFVQTKATAPNAELCKVNPLGKIPALTLSDQKTYFDSRVICRYLDDIGEGEILYPLGKYRHETLVALADGILDAAVAMFYEKALRAEESQSAEWIEAQWQKIHAALLYAQSEYPDILKHYNMGCIALGCALGYLDLRFQEREWRKIVPELAKWYDETIATRPAFIKTAPKG